MHHVCPQCPWILGPLRESLCRRSILGREKAVTLKELVMVQIRALHFDVLGAHVPLRSCKWLPTPKKTGHLSIGSCLHLTWSSSRLFPP